jgi:hypothetical protein
MVEGMAQGITAGMATGSNATFLANVERYIRDAQKSSG